MKIAKDANLQVPTDNGQVIKQEVVDKLVQKIEANEDTKYLARSIVLMWYLGSWYEPSELKRLTTPNAVPFIGHEVVSPTAYTHGWVWRVAQAHPMGYSDMQFGYWTHPPQPIADFIAVRNREGSLIMADEDVDVVIVGSGFAGALIANDLAKQGKKVVILEAGDGIQPNINGYMNRFYQAEDKVPESPYTPSLLDRRGHFNSTVNNPNAVRAGRPTVRTLSAARVEGPSAELSGPDRASAIRQHLRPRCRRHVALAWHVPQIRAERFQDEDAVRPIRAVLRGLADRLRRPGRLVRQSRGRDRCVRECRGSEVSRYLLSRWLPVPDASNSGIADRSRRQNSAHEPKSRPTRRFWVLNQPPTGNPGPRHAGGAQFAALPKPPRLRRQHQLHSDLPDPGEIRSDHHPERGAEPQKRKDDEAHGRAGNHPRRPIFVMSPRSSITRYSATSNETVTDSIKAKIFVIAGNAIETARLLLMSRNEALPVKIKTVANNSGMVGQHLMDHPYYVAWGQLPIDKADQLWPYRGPLITSGIGDLCDGPFRDRRGAFRVDIGNEGWNFVMAGSCGRRSAHHDH